jgi:hypothetical protein
MCLLQSADGSGDNLLIQQWYLILRNDSMSQNILKIMDSRLRGDDNSYGKHYLMCRLIRAFPGSQKDFRGNIQFCTSYNFVGKVSGV